jgi:hypothetical protein
MAPSLPFVFLDCFWLLALPSADHARLICRYVSLLPWFIQESCQNEMM